VVSAQPLIQFIEGYGVKPLREGQISGLNGLLLGYAAKRNIESLCLLATMPLYAVNLPNPKASKAIVDKLAKILSIAVDMREIDAAIEEMNKKMDIVAESIKDLFPGILQREPQLENKTVEDQLTKQDDKIPSHVLDRIEKLFSEAQKDKKKAYMLKSELDRWNLYKMYEDRFLSLFRDKQ
jgi:proteasome assembly chaperone (PAC2) family protein